MLRRGPVLLLLVWSQTARASDWPMWRHDARNTGFVRLRTRAPQRIKGWQFQASSHVWGYQPGMSVWSSPAVALVRGAPVVVVGSYDHNVYALDARTGARLWRFTTGGGVYSTPVVWRDPKQNTRVLVIAAASDRAIYALEAESGRRVWVHTLEAWRPTMGGARLSAPAVGRVGDSWAVLVGHWVWDKSMSGHMQEGGITALDALSGTRLWHTPLGDDQVSSPVIARLKGGDRVFVASENGNLYCLDARTGKVLWSQTERNAIMASPAVYDTPLGPRVVIGSKFGRLRCLDAAHGAPIWTHGTGHWIDGSAAVGDIGGRRVVLVGSYDTLLHAVDAVSGAALWSYRTAGGVFSSPAIASGERRTRVLFSSWDHHLHCVSGADGSLLWSAFLGRPIWDSVSLGDSIWSSPAVAEIDGQDVAYVGSYAGPFYAVPLDEAAEKALARPGSNINFWLTMPIVMAIVAGMTLLVTRRRRRR
jgi:outer membrane protein assembly factor BamB